MTLKVIQEYYPLKNSIAGFYDCQRTFTCDKIEQLEDMEKRDIPPFTEPQEGYFDFVRYMGGHEFECWTFVYWPISGYLTTTDGEDFVPMIYDEDFGWEEANPFIHDDRHIVFAPEEYGEKVDVDMVAAAFDEEAYVNGLIFTNAKELRKFVQEGKF